MPRRQPPHPSQHPVPRPQSHPHPRAHRLRPRPPSSVPPWLALTSPAARLCCRRRSRRRQCRRDCRPCFPRWPRPKKGEGAVRTAVRRAVQGSGVGGGGRRARRSPCGVCGWVVRRSVPVTGYSHGVLSGVRRLPRARKDGCSAVCAAPGGGRLASGNPRVLVKTGGWPAAGCRARLLFPHGWRHSWRGGGATSVCLLPTSAAGVGSDAAWCCPLRLPVGNGTAGANARIGLSSTTLCRAAGHAVRSVDRGGGCCTRRGRRRPLVGPVGKALVSAASSCGRGAVAAAGIVAAAANGGWERLQAVFRRVCIGSCSRRRARRARRRWRGGTQWRLFECTTFRCACPFRGGRRRSRGGRCCSCGSNGAGPVADRRAGAQEPPFGRPHGGRATRLGAHGTPAHAGRTTRWRGGACRAAVSCAPRRAVAGAFWAPLDGGSPLPHGDDGPAGGSQHGRRALPHVRVPAHVVLPAGVRNGLFICGAASCCAVRQPRVGACGGARGGGAGSGGCLPFAANRRSIIGRCWRASGIAG